MSAVRVPPLRVTFRARHGGDVAHAEGEDLAEVLDRSRAYLKGLVRPDLRARARLRMRIRTGLVVQGSRMRPIRS